MHRIYDLVFSLGANCSAAHNLKIRRLRPFSLPLDWTYIMDDKPLEWLVSAIGNHMEGFCEKENLVEIKPGHPEYNEFHRGHRKFIDTKTGYRFINHFVDSIPWNEAYEEGFAKIRRRIARLYTCFEKYDKFLLILGVRFHVREELLIELKRALEHLYPGKTFDIEVIEFNAESDGVREISNGIVQHAYVRDWNAYDTEGKNFEWHFLDGIKSRVKPKTKGKVSFHIWPRVKCIIQLHHT